MNNQLDVLVNRIDSGRLTKEKNDFVFNYHTEVSDAFVSLTMPVRAKGYVHQKLHPIFEMHLPEGYLLSIIKKHFSKITDTNDFGLLFLLAPSIKGRVHYDVTTVGQPPLSLDELRFPKADHLFQELVTRFALNSPLSGVQPKVLAKIENKATLMMDEYIVKTWGDDYPQLALNEYYCMLVVKNAGINVPEFYLSDNDLLFIMKRFDITDVGEVLGFEDMCVMQAKQRDEKYTGSYEKIAKTIKIFVSSLNKLSSLSQFFKMVVINNILENGDAHLKNFGLLYSDINSVQLAPAYDVISTTAYIQTDVPALTIRGRKKWIKKDGLIRFGIETCDLTQKQAVNLYKECLDAMFIVSKTLSGRLKQEKNIEKKMMLKHLLKLFSQCVIAK